MAIVRHTAGQELTTEQQAAMKAEIETASCLSYIDDPDSPLLTEQQLSEFHPVNFDSMEERAKAMQGQNTPAIIH